MNDEPVYIDPDPIMNAAQAFLVRGVVHFTSQTSHEFCLLIPHDETTQTRKDAMALARQYWAHFEAELTEITAFQLPLVNYEYVAAMGDY